MTAKNYKDVRDGRGLVRYNRNTGMMTFRTRTPDESAVLQIRKAIAAGEPSKSIHRRINVTHQVIKDIASAS